MEKLNFKVLKHINTKLNQDGEYLPIIFTKLPGDNIISNSLLVNLLFSTFIMPLVFIILYIALIVVNTVLIPLTIVDYIISLILWPFNTYFERKKLEIDLKTLNDELIEYESDITKHGGTPYSLKRAVYIGEGAVYEHINVGLRNFIYFFLSSLNSMYVTVDSNGRIICDVNRRRSLGDIYLICKSYYPECTLKEVLNILIKLGREGAIRNHYCTTIHKYVYHMGSHHAITSSTEYSSFKYVDIMKLLDYENSK